jgi:predicted MFS family arabinose efflux permease
MVEETARGRPVRIWRTVLAGMCASLVGVGLSRFAYAPLLPALIDAHWFSAAAAAYLGAANFAGYLGGALLAPLLAVRLPAPAVLRAMMLLAAASFFACAAPLSFAWFFLWRLSSGVAGGALMVLAAPLVLARVPPSRRGLAGGAIFTGVGVGIVLAGTLVPVLLRVGLAAAWCGLGALALGLGAVAWRGWPPSQPAAPAPHRPLRTSPALTALCLEYALNAVGLVPHMVFLADFVAHGLGEGIAAGAHYWVLFGLGAICGPVLAGHVADRVGFAAALRLAFALQTVAVVLPLLATDRPCLIVSSLVVGGFVPGIVPLVLGRIDELLPAGPARQQAWAHCTTAFALGQAGGAYALSAVFAADGGAYLPLFALGAAAIGLALLLDIATRRRGFDPAASRA